MTGNEQVAMSIKKLGYISKCTLGARRLNCLKLEEKMLITFMQIYNLYKHVQTLY
jgi:hypothetical protein